MKDLLRIALLLDESGKFHLSDKLFKIAQYQSNIDEIPIEMRVRRLEELRYLQRQDNQKIEEAKEKYNNNEISSKDYQKIYDEINDNQTSQEIKKLQQSQIWKNQFPNDQTNANNRMKYPQNMPGNLSETRVMDSSQYLNNPYTPKDIMDIRKKLIPTDFRGEMYRANNSSLIQSNNPQSFAINFMEYARVNKFPNLQAAFDDYANNGATYNGQNVNTVPELVELYKRISKTPSAITRQMLAEELYNIFNNPKITK